MTMLEPVPSGQTSLQQDLLKQLRLFLAGATSSAGNSRGNSNPRLAQTALHLLVHLPAARDAVFEYYGTVLDGIVGRHGGIQGDAGQLAVTEDEEVLIEELQKVLSGFIESNPDAWAPWVSAWALDNLGKMSTKWSLKISGPLSSPLHDKLSAWLSCPAARCLLELAAACLSTLLTSTDTDACVSSLLETSVRHAPHFDWVVAHLGSCFPHTVTSRVLSLGLKEFTSAAASSQVTAEVSLTKVPKLVSVVNILSHLGTTHPVELEDAVHSLLQTSFTSTNISMSTIATVPFLIHLSSLSSNLRHALASGLSTSLPPNLPRIAALAPSWVQGKYFSSVESLLTLVSHLLVQTDQGGPELLLLLLKLGAKPDQEAATLQAKNLTHLVLAEVHAHVHGASRSRLEEGALLSSLTPHLPTLFPLLLSNNSFQVAAVTQLLTLHCLYRGRASSSLLFSYLLLHSNKSSHLSTLGYLLASLELWHPGMAIEGIAKALRSPGEDKDRLLDNLATLVLMETKGKDMVYRSSIVKAVRNQHSLLCESLSQHPEAVLLLLSLVPPDSILRVSTLHKLCHALVQVVYTTLALGNQVTPEARARRLGQVEDVLMVLARQTAGLQVILRFLLEAALHSFYSEYLGGFTNNEEITPRQKATISLLKENTKFSSMPVQPLGSTTVFHAGIIGAGPLPGSLLPSVGEIDAEENRRAVSGLVLRLCEGGGQEGTKQLALLLVEMVSPDIMYNGLPWPEEEFIKVTIERDLSISRLLSSQPLVWDLLALLARARPALCYCSVLVRAVVAVSIFHWQSHITSRLTEHPEQLEITRRVLELMAVGQFLPPQLALVPQVMHIFDPAQLHCILIDIWNFMKMNVPGPSLFSMSDGGESRGEAPNRDFGPYKNYHAFCERLRVVLVSHIDSQSAVLKTYFVDALSEDAGSNGHDEL